MILEWLSEWREDILEKKRYYLSKQLTEIGSKLTYKEISHPHHNEEVNRLINEAKMTLHEVIISENPPKIWMLLNQLGDTYSHEETGKKPEPIYLWKLGSKLNMDVIPRSPDDIENWVHSSNFLIKWNEVYCEDLHGSSGELNNLMSMTSHCNREISKNSIKKKWSHLWILRRSRHFRNFPEVILQKLVMMSKKKHYKKWEVIIEQWEQNFKVFVLLKWVVKIYSHDRFIMELRRGWDFLGEMSIFSDDHLAWAQAVASTSTDWRELNRGRELAQRNIAGTLVGPGVRALACVRARRMGQDLERAASARCGVVGAWGWGMCVPAQRASCDVSCVRVVVRAIVRG